MVSVIDMIQKYGASIMIPALVVVMGCSSADNGPEAKAEATKIERVDGDESSGAEVAATTAGGTQAGTRVATVQPVPQIAFFDSYAFDVDLSSALRDEPVMLPVEATFDLNNIPERMDNWLARIVKEGGKVQARPIPKEEDLQTRGIVSAIIDLFIAASEAAEREVIYGPVDEYDAILHFDQDTKEVTHVEFIKR